MLKVGIYGATGRVGKLLIENIEHHEQIHLSCLHAIDSFTFAPPKNIPITDNLKTLFELSDIIIDFSSPKGTAALLEQAKITPKPLVIGTTGLGESEFKLLKDVSRLAPVLYSTNMSLGVAVLNKLVSLASSALKEFDIEIVEQHHRYKKDAPSGTALTLAEHAARSRGVELNNVRVSGRDGLIGARTKDEIAVMSLRGGDIVGRHTVGFYNEGEFLELNHTATSRETFAKGALRAAKWLIKQPNGIYNINDCLGLNN